MEKKVMDTLHAMICGEIEDIAKKGTLSHETLDVLKDLLESEKNLMKIKKYKKEEDAEWEMDRGYSQRKYYIDADYEPYRGHSYGRDDMYRDPRYDRPWMGYSRTGSKDEMISELHRMMSEATDPTVKTAIQEAITKLNKQNERVHTYPFFVLGGTATFPKTSLTF